MTGATMPGGKAIPAEPHPAVSLRLGGDIVRQFEHWPDQDATAEEIATHIKKFWEPRMRHELMAHVRLGDTAMPRLLAMAAAHLVDGDYDHVEAQTPSGG
ncbi:MAG TPA: formate dehydrogenase subunit delta [Phycicoccus sp.]|nr:formate dehydrogenase subunit delta [Phycicoccus sp.]